MPPKSHPRKDVKRRRSRSRRSPPVTSRARDVRGDSFFLGLSTAFARRAADDVEHRIEEWIGKLTHFIGVDRTSLWELAPAGEQARLLYQYSPRSVQPLLLGAAEVEREWLANHYHQGEPVAWSRNAHAKTVLSIPISAGPVARLIMFTCVRRSRPWPASLISRLRLAGEIFSSAIVRQHVDAALHSIQDVERLRFDLMQSGRVALMGQLTALLAHELMQPIAAAVGNAEAIQRLLADEVAEPCETRAILTDIVESCVRAADVVSKVRSRVNPVPSPHRPLNLNQLVMEVAELMHSDLIRRQVRLVTHFDAALPQISGAPVELQQVILNLVLNGADALSQRSPPERELVIATAQCPDGVELVVRDQGVGADPAHLQAMFEPFFTTKAGGIGMGLAISRAIVEAHSGHLTATNNADGGVTVRCLLPLPSPSQPAC
jgi:C4-dicarboxylate-specific signal transduction histidine kinase